MAQSDPVELLICTQCRQGQEVPEGAERPGAELFAALAANPPEGCRVTPVACLSNCSRGCTVALRGAGRWSYVYGALDGSLIEDLSAGAAKYAASADGLVPWRDRPEHFRKNCIARIPPLETSA